MAESYFFYDYESFGINTSTDRPAQFGGIRTDSELNIIGEPEVFYCKQTDDYLPNPEAVMVTGILPQECNEKGLAEPKFAQRIHEEFSQPETCIVGYNNIRFDDEMTRYTFYRNFIDPYAYSWKNGNSRWDLLDVLRTCYALRPDGINWVHDENGFPSFRLELLTQANGIAHENAHDAMADVYATIAMAKLVKTAQPRLYNYLYNLRHKKEVEKLIDTVNMTPLVHVSGMLGAYRANTTWIVPIAWHPTNKNAVIVCDLNSNLDELLSLDAAQLKENLYTKKERLQEEGKLSVPLKLVHINKCPVLAPFKTLDQQRAIEIGLDIALCEANIYRLRESATIRDKVMDIFQQDYDDNAVIEENEVESALYRGFFGNGDREKMDIIQNLDEEGLKGLEMSFSDKRIEPLLFHYKARHFYRTLTRAEQIRWSKYRWQQLEMQAEPFNQRLQELIAEHQDNPQKLHLLEQLYLYAQKVCQ